MVILDSQVTQAYTSDLFQVKVCEEHKKAQRDAKKEERKALLSAVKAQIAAKKATKSEPVETETASA